jgi:hypothetical protein
MVVSEADRIKVVERLVGRCTRTSGDSPLKRKRAIYRALDRKDSDICVLFDHEIAFWYLVCELNRDMYRY